MDSFHQANIIPTSHPCCIVGHLNYSDFYTFLTNALITYMKDGGHALIVMLYIRTLPTGHPETYHAEYERNHARSSLSARPETVRQQTAPQIMHTAFSM